MTKQVYVRQGRSIRMYDIKNWFKKKSQAKAWKSDFIEWSWEMWNKEASMYAYSSGPDTTISSIKFCSLWLFKDNKRRWGESQKHFFELATFTSLGVGAVREILLLSTFPVSGCFIIYTT